MNVTGNILKNGNEINNDAMSNREEKKQFHLLASSSTSLAIIAFISSTLGYPKEVLSSSAVLSTKYIPIFLLISLNLSFVVLSFFKRKRGNLVLLTSNVVNVILSLVTISAFLSYTSTNLEPWIFQFSWFIAHDGFIIGLFLGGVMFSAVTSLSIQISLISTRDNKRKNFVESSLIVLIAFLEFGILTVLYRWVNPISCLILIFVLIAIQASMSIMPVLTRGLTKINKLEIPMGKTRFYRATKSANPASKKDPLKRIHHALEQGGTERISFWWFLILTILGDLFVIYSLIRYDKGTFDNISYILALVVTWIVYNGFSYARKRSDDLYFSYGVKRWKTAGLGFFNGLRTLLIIMALSGIIYFFPFMIYFPEVVAKVSIGAIGGVIVFMLVSKNKNAKILLMILSLALVFVNYMLLFNDALENAYNYYGPEDVFFPFLYIHSWSHVLSSGFALGYVLTNEVSQFITRNNKGGDSTQRAIMISILTLTLGVLISYFGWGVLSGIFPGGRIEVWSSLDLTWAGNPMFSLTFNVLILFTMGIILIYIISRVYILVMISIEKTKNRAHVNVSREARKGVQEPGKSVARGNHVNSRKQYKTILIMAALTTLIFISGGITISTTFNKFRAKPIVYYDSGNFALWLLNSSERVSPTEVVALDPRNVVNNFTIHAAANEYVAFQLVWTPLGKSVNDLNVDFSNFYKVGDNSTFISKDNFEARYEELIIDNNFPDKLVAFSDLDLHENRNHVFWISARIPYSTSQGYYSGSLFFSYDKYVDWPNPPKSIQLNFTIQVWNFSIPKMRHLRTQMGSPYSSQTETLEDFVAHRINDYGISIPCTLNTTTNNWTFNWASWDSNIQWKLDHGANSFILSGYGWTYDGRTPFVDNATLMERLKNWLKGVEAHLIAKNWTRYGYLYYIDEFQMFIPASYNNNRTAYFKDIETQLKAMKQAAPNIRIMTTTPPSSELANIRDYIDIYCPIATDYNKTEWEEQMAAGKEFWMYFCVGPSAPWPNSHLYNRLYETRIMLWQAFLYGLQGFLYWSSSAQYHGRYGFAFNSWGDGWFIHYDKDGHPIDSPRWENYLDAQEDFEILWLVNHTISFLENNSSAYSESEISSFKNKFSGILSSVVGEREIHTQNVKDLYNAHLELSRMLHDFSSHVNISAIAEREWDFF
ncbi:MAG: glycoside hydrolase domain-containing protein [Promethearchaeota archaeon]